MKRVLKIYIFIGITIIAILSVSIFTNKPKDYYRELTANETAFFDRIFERKAIQKTDLRVIYFDPGCESCKNKINNLKRSGQPGHEKILLFVSSADSLRSLAFLKKNLSLSIPYQFYSDKNLEFRNTLKIYSVPTAFDYLARNSRLKFINSF
jgi:hypothetical protein